MIGSRKETMSNILDLHGKHVHEAWRITASFLQRAYYDGYSRCEIICGQGLIKQEIETWLHLSEYVREYRLNSRTQGSYSVKLKDKR